MEWSSKNMNIDDVHGNPSFLTSTRTTTYISVTRKFNVKEGGGGGGGGG